MLTITMSDGHYSELNKGQTIGNSIPCCSDLCSLKIELAIEHFTKKGVAIS